MPRKRRPPTLEDVLAYAIGRKRKLKGPRKDLYSFIINQCLGADLPTSGPGGLCNECETNLKDRPSKRAMQFERSQRN